MLPVNKDVIINFARKYGVPYFLDTTPTWSNRGKMRNQLIPLCQDMFGSGVLGKLSQIAAQSEEIASTLDTTLFQTFKSTVEVILPRKIVSIGINTSSGATDSPNFVDMPMFFWRTVLSEICHGQGWPMIGNKALREMLIWYVFQSPYFLALVCLTKSFAGLSVTKIAGSQ